MNSDLDLTTAEGYVVQGFGVDRNYNVIPGILTDINIPIGQMTIARATSEAVFAGNLNAGGEIATQGSVVTSQALDDFVAGTLSDTSLLMNVTAASDPSTPLFAAGDTLTLTPNKGGRTLPASDLDITAATTIADLNAWLEGALGIQTDPGLAGSPGVRVVAGHLEITGNAGTENNIGVSDLFLVSDNATTRQPLTFTQDQAATGESCRTSFGVYDSLGTSPSSTSPWRSTTSGRTATSCGGSTPSRPTTPTPPSPSAPARSRSTSGARSRPPPAPR